MTKEEQELFEKSKYIVITPDGVGSKGDEAMISGCLELLRGDEVLLLTPNTHLWQDELLARTHLFHELYVPLEQMNELFVDAKQLIVIGADTLDGSCGYESAHWRLETIKQAIAVGGQATIFCSIRSDVPEKLEMEWQQLPDAVRVLVRDDTSAENFFQMTGKRPEHFSDLAFFSKPLSTIRGQKLRTEIEESAKGKTVIGLEISETMFRSFHTEIKDVFRREFAQKIAELAVENMDAENTCVVLLTHDTRSWEAHWSDFQYAQQAKIYLERLRGFRSVILQPPTLTQQELLHIVDLCDVVICGRMHMSITTYCSGTVPVLVAGIGKNYVMIDKVRGMCKERMGTDENLILDPMQIPTKRDWVLNHPTLKQQIRQKNTKLGEQEQAQMEMLRKQIGVHQPTFNDNEIIEIQLIKALQESERLRALATQQQSDINNQTLHLQQLMASERNLQSDKQQLEHQQQQAEQSIQAERRQKEEALVTIYKQQQDIGMLNSQIANMAEQMAQLQARSDILNTVYASRTWRYSHKLVRIGRKIFPVGSVRAKVVGAMLRVPLRVEHWLRAFPANRRAKKAQQQAAKHFYEQLPPLMLSLAETPLVSIVLPVYNQFPFTYNCLRTISETCMDVPYEVILADDNSNDETVKITEKVSGLIVVRNDENQRFLLNCNHAAQKAKGKYILFLNNDTEVQANWLQSLCEVIEADESVGMVGSKLIYANGQLQEAGGILWADGSAWNYGHGDDPEKSEYNYVKEVDYISGCSMMIRRSLWEEIGGFDERFVPAYCEDSDLAFEVRAHGYKVIYQPNSVVIHHEGISNGTDTACGQKQYQIVNTKKFYEKWESVLKHDQLEHAKNVFCARDRSCGKPCVLFIDHYTPTYDQDAGSRTVFEYLRLFVQMGYNVKFIPDNFYRMPKYCEALQQLGIEVLYGPEYAQHWKEWVIENREVIKFVFTNRPHISIKYIDFLRENTNAKIAYYGHDLHFLRELREYELTGDKTKLESSDKWKAIEFALMRKADVAYYPSKIEQDIIHESDPSINVKVLVPYIFDEVNTPDYVMKQRQDIMFLGGFNHGPNVDAVLWFAKEIWPLVQQKLPQLRWHILGSHPPKEVEALASKMIKVHGFVTDEELARFYAECRMSVVPLRYGAGIKGKVVEAMKFGIPVLTTSVGAEGILGAEKGLAIENDPKKFAESLCTLYNNEDALRDMSVASCEYIRTQYGPENAMNLIKEDFT